MLKCQAPDCGQKTLPTERARAYMMCEDCLRKAEAEIGSLGQGWRKVFMLPVLYFGDLQMIANRVNDMKGLAWIMGITAQSIRIQLKVRRPHTRLPRWLALAVYRPLWGPWAVPWLDILPQRVSLAAGSVRRRKSQAPSWRVCRYIRSEALWLRLPGRLGSKLTPGQLDWGRRPRKR